MKDRVESDVGNSRVVPSLLVRTGHDRDIFKSRTSRFTKLETLLSDVLNIYLYTNYVLYSIFLL